MGEVERARRVSDLEQRRMVTPHDGVKTGGHQTGMQQLMEETIEMKDRKEERGTGRQQLRCVLEGVLLVLTCARRAAARYREYQRAPGCTGRSSAASHSGQCRLRCRLLLRFRLCRLGTSRFESQRGGGEAEDRREKGDGDGGLKGLDGDVERSPTHLRGANEQR